MPREHNLWKLAMEARAREIPDARPRDSILRKKGEVYDRYGQLAERIYCVHCAAPGGAVTKGWALHFIWVCDRCAETWGPLTLPEIPEDLIITKPTP